MRVRKEEVKESSREGGRARRKGLAPSGADQGITPIVVISSRCLQYLQICFHPDHCAQHSARGVGEGYSTREQHRRGGE